MASFRPVEIIRGKFRFGRKRKFTKALVVIQFAPLSFGIFPAIFQVQPTTTFSRMLIRVSTDSLPETLKFLERQWREIRPDKPFLYYFQYYFQDQALGQLLQAERRWTQVVGLCSLLAILLAGMGVFGLTSISLNARVKEIGIRKTFGAPSARIVGDAYRDFLGPGEDRLDGLGDPLEVIDREDENVFAPAVFQLIED
jgi:putative ABC transport system permease protein